MELEYGSMVRGGKDSNRYYVWNELELVEECLTNQNGREDENMRYNPDSFTQKESRRKKIDRNRKDRFDDYIKEKRVRRPRTKNIKHYDYDEWNE